MIQVFSNIEDAKIAGIAICKMCGIENTIRAIMWIYSNGKDVLLISDRTAIPEEYKCGGFNEIKYMLIHTGKKLQWVGWENP